MLQAHEQPDPIWWFLFILTSTCIQVTGQKSTKMMDVAFQGRFCKFREEEMAEAH